MPPSVAVSVLFLRAYEGVSFAEKVERTKYDLRWKVAWDWRWKRYRCRRARCRSLRPS